MSRPSCKKSSSGSSGATRVSGYYLRPSLQWAIKSATSRTTAREMLFNIKEKRRDIATSVQNAEYTDEARFYLVEENE